MSLHKGKANTVSVTGAALHTQEVRSENYTAELNSWLRKSHWGIYLKEQEKNRKMDSNLMSCSWIRKQMIRDRKRTTKGEERKVTVLLLQQKKRHGGLFG